VIKKQISNPENYYLSVRFLWGGRIQDETYKIPYADRKLTVSVTQPKIVYPGQRSRIEVLVTDADGEPVPGVDLTAYGLTLKFNYTAPSLPDLNEYRKEKTVINNFSIKPQQILNSKGLLLDYETWKLMASADTIEYYKFIYPDSVIYRYEYYTDDSLTQFSPFIVSEGEFQPVHVIWVDSKPVYFSWSTHRQPYSFRISSGLHKVKIRTDRKTIFFDNLYFPPGKKLIFSIDENREYKQVSIMRSKPELSSYEQRILYNYIFPYRYDFGDRYAYIEQEGEVQLLKPDRSNRYNNLAGPVSGKVTFSLIDSFSTIFTHEPYFEYDFSPGLLKMRSVTTKGRYPEYLSHFSTGKPLTDTYYTKDRIHREWIRYLDLKRYNTAQYRNPSVTCEGAGKLLVEFEKTPGKTKDLPLNILLFRYDDHRFTRVYPGNARLFHDLDPGYHRMIFFYTGAKYHVLDSVLVRANGTNYYEISQPQSFRKDTFSLFVSDLIEKTLFSTKPFVRNEYKELRQIFNSYSQQFSFTGEGEIREGYVYDAEYGDALPGVTVLVKGTTIGTITDINGYYCLKVPSANSVLEFNYVGYSSEEVPAGSEACRTVHLSADILALDEVVVVGYGTTSAQYCTGAVSTVTSESLLNSLPGMESQLAGVLSGKVAGISIMDQSGAPGQVRITIRGASSPTLMDKPLFIIDGNVYTGDISDLPADMIENLQILKDESATAIYGAQGANGVVIISTKSGGFKSPLTPKSKGADYDDAFFGVASQASSIRDNFSDYAFWEPRLITDSAGRAVFEVQFPDDVTSWKTYFLAMNEERQTGQAEDIIKSYKPMMAQLAVPRFLVESDTCYAIGKILNYTADSLKVITKFELDGIQQQSKSRYCVNSLIDSLPVIAREDSIAVKYYLEKEDGYFDGELKNIPVFPVGLEETSGSFIVMDHDTAVTVKADSALGIATVYARADILEVLEDEISHLIHYKYGCNEQIASKLKALLADKAIAEYRGKKFTSDRQVQKMIRLLLKNQKSSGLWGWWKNGADSYWISLHVVEALTSAQFAGYPVRLNQKPLSENLVWELENSRSFENSYRLLKILGLLQAQIDYSNYILKMEQMEQMEHRDLNSLLKLQEIRQLCHLNYDVDTLKAYRQTTLFGNVFFSDEELKTSLTVNDIQNTLLAYRILRNDSITDPEILRRIRNYFMEQRHTGYWGNTYEAASILVNLLPDLLKGKEEPETPELFFEGDTNMIIREFPFKTELLPGQSMQIRKEGDFPVYLTSYQRFWNKQPCEKKGDFAISTCFENIPDNRLKAGQEVKLVATLVVHKDAEYVMVNIPVPGGCSYASKKTYYGPESHREYFRQETAIFLEELKRGTYTFEIELTARYTGSYTLNPAKVELMYFPTFSANNRIKRVIIE
jgi:TonB-dependent SusC/RagA subfamily outer membrane receptor